MKKTLVMCVALSLTLCFTGCGSQSGTTSSSASLSNSIAESSEKDGTGSTVESTLSGSSFSVAMITDSAGVNDQSFNQSAWEGLQEFNKETGTTVNYLESKQSSDYTTNLERLGDSGAQLIWAIGFDTSDALLEVANENPDLKYAIVDNSYDDTPNNVTGVIFKAQEPSFLVGYVAGKTTTTNQVGFVGGIENKVIQQFMYGYEAGVAYAGKESGKKITVTAQYAESFSDAAKGKAIASKMFSDGCDIVYQAAGGTGSGVIEAAKESGKYAIGVDRDQAYLAPDNVLTSALKKVGTAIQKVSAMAMNGEDIGGKTMTFGLSDDCVGIPESNPNMDPAVYKATLAIEDEIKSGKITPPSTEDEYNTFMSSLS